MKKFTSCSLSFFLPGSRMGNTGRPIAMALTTINCRRIAAMKNTLYLFLMLMAGFGMYGQTIRYVKEGGTGNGTSWANASGDVQAMINASTDGNQVWVAAGTYQRGPGQYYRMVNGVKIYGGFPATGTPVFTDRNWKIYTTTLKGNNSTVIFNTGAAITNTALLDGFTIMGGNFPYGGGIYNEDGASPTMSNLIVTGNYSSDSGGGICNSFSSPAMNNITISNNTTLGRAGGLLNHYCSPVMNNITIFGNTGADGGGMLCEASLSTMTNILVYGNSAPRGGGVSLKNSAITAVNMTIANNTATGSTPESGGIYIINTPSPPSFSNTIIYGNKTAAGAVSNVINNASTPNFRYSLIQGSGGSSAWNSAFGTNSGNNIDVSPMFANAGSYKPLPGSPVVNTGSAALFTGAATATDVAGNARLVGTAIDMGAYESQGVVPAGGILYVVKNATGNGSAWNNALGELADALKAAKLLNTAAAGSVTQIWVAGGAYYPLYTANTLEGGNSVNRDNAFLLVPDVKVYGGFAGNEATLAGRNLELTATASILNGDFNNDDTYNSNGQPNANNTENAYHVVLSVGAVGTAELNGFTVKGGYANSSTGNTVNGESVLRNSGGGICMIKSSPIIRNTTITKNRVSVLGGGIYASGTATPLLDRLTISANSAPSGGGMCVYGSAPVLTNVAISKNAATTGTGGGGMYIILTASPTLTNVTFTGNTASTGGGLYNAAAATLVNVLFISNTATTTGGGMATNNGSATLTNVTMTGNQSQNSGGGMSCNGASVQVSNSIVWGNTGSNTQNVQNASSTIVWTNSLLQGSGGSSAWNSAFGTNGGNNIDVSPMFTNASNYKPMPGSPVVNAGSTALFTGAATATDLAGNARLVGTAIDMGAYESQGVVPAAGIVYVVKNATGNGSGWNNALGELADALKAATLLNTAAAGTVTQIWVAGGTYNPLYTSNGLEGGNSLNRDNAFVLVKDVKVYGGFAGTETALAQRDWQANETLLSGDLGIQNNTSDNAYHIVISAGDVGTAELNGFTVKGGNANIVTLTNVNAQNVHNEFGSGVYTVYSSPVLSNLVISSNTAQYGAGNTNDHSSPVISNVAINSNTGTAQAGGIYNSYSPIALTNATITGNTGHGIVSYNSSPSFGYTTISGNTGDGISNVFYSSPSVTNVVISGNGDDGIDNDNLSVTTLVNATISGNAGYGLNNNGLSPVYMRNTIIYGNGNSIRILQPIVRNNSLVQGVFDTSNSNITALIGPAFTDAPSYTSAPFTGGDYRLLDCSPLIDKGNNTFVSGVASDLTGNPRLYNSTVDMGAYERQTPAAMVAAPVAPNPQAFSIYDEGLTIASLTVTGSGLEWYSAATGNTPLAEDTPLVEGTYYVNSTSGECESMFTEVNVVKNHPPIAYVKPVATGTGDGTSWENASGNLQAMISASGVEQVWVAAGTYKPAVIAGNGSGERDKAFVLKNNVKVYGGFAGTETDLAQRDWNTNISVLSGDLGAADDMSDNAYHVIISAGAVGTAVLDGFTITRGNSNVNGYYPIVNGQDIDATFGAGIYCVGSAPALNNLVITNNRAQRGGAAVYNWIASPILSNVIMSSNTNNYDYATLYNDYQSSVILTDVTISGNIGYGMEDYSSSSLLTNVVITGNTTYGIVAGWGSTATLNNSTISGNGNYGLAGGLFVLNNTVVYGNANGINGQSVMNNSVVQGVGESISGNLFMSAPSYTTAPFAGGDYRPNGCSVLINAGSNTYATGIATDLSGSPRIYNAATVDIGAYEYHGDFEATPAPVAGPQSFEEPPTVADLAASGSNLKWYLTAAAVTWLDAGTVLESGTYYVSQTINGCEGPRVAVAITVAYEAIRYVKTNATGTGDGTSWANASGDLQAMIDDIGVQQVWVAEGDYYAPPSSFTMKQGVKIYGGFPASGSAMAGRNTGQYPTKLIGNNNHVILNDDNQLTGTALLDGFIIQGGSAARGGGMYNYNSYPSISNCIFRYNSSSDWGGAILNWGSGSTTITNCLFNGNTSYYGGAVLDAFGAHTVYTNVTFADNMAYVQAGALYCYMNSAATLYNCIFYANTSNIDEIMSSDGGSATAYNCQITVDNGTVSGPFTANNVFGGDPLFIYADGGDYRLQPSSPAINAGNTSYFANAAASKDLSGSQRLSGGTIDLGPYEYTVYCSGTTAWDGESWSNGAPVSYEYSAVINGDYNSAEDGNITACSLTVNSGNVVIASGDNFTIKGVIEVDEAAAFTVEHNANLIQADDVDNIGIITVIKESAPMYRLDYAQWSSPVAGQKLKDFSPETLNNRFYTYNPLSDAFATVTDPVNTDFVEGKGYLIRVANNHPAFVTADIDPTPWEGTFTGVPNNGHVNVAVIPANGAVQGYNAVGNPYPSSINIKAFFEANQDNLANNTPIYFWRKKNDANTSSYCSLTLAGYNQNSGNLFGDSSNGVFDNPNYSYNWVINPGQGFIVMATGNTVSFSNDMRVAVNNGQMFRSAQDEDATRSRLWLNLTNAEGAFGQATIAYTPLTTLGLDFGWDGKALTDGEVAIYSLAEEEKLGIQARPAFDAADEVPIEYRITTAGNYTISLDHFDGVFAQGQEIYLKDNLLGITHNLEAPYGFVAEAGTVTGRFDVVYAEALSTHIPKFNPNSIIVYKQGSAININSGNEDMKSVSVYDTRGRLLYRADNINASATSITTLQAQEEMLIVEVTTIEGVKVSRKIVF